MLPQSRDRRGIHAAVLGAPLVDTGVTEALIAAQLLHRHTHFAFAAQSSNCAMTQRYFGMVGYGTRRKFAARCPIARSTPTYSTSGTAFTNDAQRSICDRSVTQPCTNTNLRCTVSQMLDRASRADFRIAAEMDSAAEAAMRPSYQYALPSLHLPARKHDVPRSILGCASVFASASVMKGSRGTGQAIIAFVTCMNGSP